ncbi:MAG: phosphatase PAP2 family protein [Flexilinea sp.]|nr:phosphatase PAP2 family protein [Flexilinea sp.]
MGNAIIRVFFELMHYATLPGAMALFCVVVFMTDDRKHGKTMMLSFSAAAALNTLLKVLFRIPRPWMTYAESAPFLAEGGFAFPCLHTQVTAAVLYAFALLSGKRLPGILCAAGICITAAVRVISGVQSCVDVLVGAAAGIICTVLICCFRSGGNAVSARLTGGIVFLTGLAAAVFFDDPWGAGSALSVFVLDLLESISHKADEGRTRLGKLYGTVLAIGIYFGICFFLPFLIEWLITPLWPGQILIVFLLTLLPCLLSFFPVF